MKLGYIYITICPNKKVYIGQHQSEIHDSKYYGSGKILRNVIKKYGKESLTNRVLEWCDTNQELDAKEKWWISYFRKSKFDCINIDKGGKGATALTRHKLRKSHKELASTDEHINRFKEHCQSACPSHQADDKYYEITPVRRQDFKRRCRSKNLNFDDYIEVHTATKAHGKRKKFYCYFKGSVSRDIDNRNYDDELLLKQYATELTPRSTFKTSCKHRGWSFDDFEEIFAGWYIFPNDDNHRAKRFYYVKRAKE